MRTNTVRMRRVLIAGVTAVAAVVVSGASGVSSSATITTIAGSGEAGYSGDGGSAIRAKMYAVAVAVDGRGNVYIADFQSDRVRKVSPAGTITTLAGTGSPFASGDGGPATSAGMNPRAVAVDGQGNVYIVDRYPNNRVRKVSPNGTVTTFAGTGAPDSANDTPGPATQRALANPNGLFVRPDGTVYILDLDHATALNRDVAV